MLNEIFLRKNDRNLGKLAGAALLGVVLLSASATGAQAQPSAKQQAAAQKYGRSTGLPLPRFASLKADPARLRRGPGVDYPILWEITRRGLPVRITGEYGHWRRVELHDGSQGWMHRVLLSGRRTALITGETRRLRAEPYRAAAPVAKISATTPLRLDECARGWCAVEGSGVRGWAPIEQVWGADAARAADGS